MNWNEYGAFIIEETKNLLAIDSPSGMTKKAAEHVAARFEALGYAPQTPRKDGVLVCLGGRDRENGLLLERAYRAAGIDLAVFLKPGCNHHPHGLADPTPVVAFLERH